MAGCIGHTELVETVQHCALCLLIGTRMPALARTGLETALDTVRVASIGAEPPFLPAAHATVRDLRAGLSALAGELSPAHPPGPVAPCVSAPLPVPPLDGAGMRYREAVEALAVMLPADADVFADAGDTGASVVHHLPVSRGGRFVVALGVGGMGYSFGASIGSAFARQRRTLVIAGDGAFFMHGMEIHTAIEHRLPITFVVFDNNAHAMCVTREQLFYGDRYSFDRFRPSRIAEGVAAMFPSMPAYPAGAVDQLFDALELATSTSGPSFIAVDCDADEIPPFPPFLQ